jgi:RND superfamily putative drug exporter
MREAHIHGQAARQSVVHGFDQASRVVVAAAIIMVAVFSGFIVSYDIMIKQVGFALAAGILIDAFLVRLTLIPALMAVFDDRAWWLPRWLDRLLPDLDIEGDKLLTMLNQQAAATSPQDVEARN